MKWYIISLTKSIQAKNEEEALKKFDYLLETQGYESDNFAIDEVKEDEI